MGYGMTNLLVKYITLCLEIWVPIKFTLFLHSEKFQIWNQIEVWGSVCTVIIDESALTAAVND
jgi:putative heme iron utilization protein